ncbi:MAG: hypothetical protein OJF55_002809 [Rhodanobacteraceae bacterium]|jgi:hypothetical protein|nr:MAG: hypothetical protein OJF55_002809 [Rhodanobacteraceae bacterium]
MHDLHAWAAPRIAAARARAVRTYHSHTARKAALIVAIVLVVFGLLGFLAAPPVIRSQIQKQASAALGRQVTVGHVRFDPYTLRLQLDRVQVAGRAGEPPLATIDQAVINASWVSLFRLAPVLDVLSLQRPALHIARSAPGQFNFSDILARLAAQPSKSNAPFRYAVSNITVSDGSIDFADAVTHSTRRIDHIDVGIPFIANLPSDTDIFVKPLLAMQVDGSPIRVTGSTKPFANSRESDIAFHFQQLDLPRYLGYMPAPLPFSIPKGSLSGDLTLHFAATTATPQLRLSGNLQFDGLTLDSAQRQPILALQQGSIQLTDVEPLLSRYAFGVMRLDGAQLWYTETGAGHSNFDSLLAPSAPAAKGAKPGTPTDLRIASLALADSTFHYTDADKQQLELGKLHGTIAGLSLLAALPARLDLAAQLDGGEIAAKGTLDLAKSKLDAALTLQQVGLAPLQGVAAVPLAGHTADGKLSSTGELRLDWGTPFNVQLGKTHASISDFALQPHGKVGAAPIAWQKLDATLDAFDLATHTAQLDAVTADGLKLDVVRNAAQRINLLQLFASPAHSRATKAQPEPWHWSVAHVGFQQSALAFTDHAAGAKPVTVKLDKLQGSLDKLSDKFDAAIPATLSGAIGRGTFKLAGTLRPSPLEADLQVETSRLGIAALGPYIGVPLNVTLSRAEITSRGKLRYDARGAVPRIAYRGDAALDHVSIQDKLTGDDFLRWRELRATRLDATYGSGTPRIDIGNLTFAGFYARMIINANGRLNVSDVIANPAAQPVSVTRANAGASATSAPTIASTAAPAATTGATPATTGATAAAATGTPPAADIRIGGITLAYGQLNFTDNFIKPNYTANLTRLNGKIGAFGTQAGMPPAAITLEAALNDNAPVTIDGTMNPLQPQAQLDVTGKADGVELTQMSTYATQYTGYPITAGKLKADVHYTLDQRKLSANNHFFITQLTFGDRVESPGIRHLPVKLAVALLKDSQGNVDINLPVSGSLDNPQFSIGGLVWRAFVGLITKAVTAPFRLLGAAFGGGQHEDLDYIAFAPGSAVLDANAQGRLKLVAAMLQKKPDLKLEITGRVDPAKDVPGLRKVTVDDAIRRARLQDTKGKHTDTSPAALAAVQITPDEYEKYLKRAYKHDDFKGKPRDFLGLKLPKPEEMRKLMANAVPTGQRALQALAERRADAVRAWLIADGKLPGSRIAVVAPKLDANGIDDQGPTTRVQFGIAQH